MKLIIGGLNESEGDEPAQCLLSLISLSSNYCYYRNTIIYSWLLLKRGPRKCVITATIASGREDESSFVMQSFLVNKGTMLPRKPAKMALFPGQHYFYTALTCKLQMNDAYGSIGFICKCKVIHTLRRNK